MKTFEEDLRQLGEDILGGLRKKGIPFYEKGKIGVGVEFLVGLTIFLVTPLVVLLHLPIIPRGN